MTRWIWGLAIAAIAAWSLLSWGTYALVVHGGDWLATNADLIAWEPRWQYWLQWSLRLVEQFGVVLLWIVWGVVTLGLLVAAWLTARFANAARRYVPQTVQS